MVRILVIGDLHVEKSNLNIYKDVFEEILTLIDEINPDMVVSLGDSLDSHERIFMRSLTTVTNFYLKVAKKVKSVIIIIGNHDRENNRDFMSSIHPFVGLIGQKNITVVDKTTYEEIDNCKFLFIPYVPNGRFHEALAEIEYYPITFAKDGGKQSKVVPNLIFAHQEFRGATLAKNIVSSKGDGYSSDMPPCISGHLHDYHQVGNILYAGTPMQHDFDESDDKALLNINFDVNKNIFTIDRIKLKTITKKVTIQLTPETLPTFSSLLPANNAISGKDVNLKTKLL